jgi:hypothetical protein
MPRRVHRLALWAAIAAALSWPAVLSLIRGEIAAGLALLAVAAGLTAFGVRRSRQYPLADRQPPGAPAVRRWAIGTASLSTVFLALAVRAVARDVASAAVISGALTGCLAYLALRMWESASLLEAVAARLGPREALTTLCVGRIEGLGGWLRPAVVVGADESRVVLGRFAGWFRGEAEVVPVLGVDVPQGGPMGRISVTLEDATREIVGLHPTCPEALQAALLRVR